MRNYEKSGKKARAKKWRKMVGLRGYKKENKTC